MKKLVVIFCLIASAQAFAKSVPATLTCSSGIIGEDDHFVKVTISQSTIEFQRHETFVSAKRSLSRTSGNTIAILDKTVRGSAEEAPFTAKASALLVYDKNAGSLNVSLILDGSTEIPALILNCK